MIEAQTPRTTLVFFEQCMSWLMELDKLNCSFGI
jgi:hypothetical protein